MIKQAEIRNISELTKVTKSQVDKDWVLSYLLYAIISMPELKNILVFKGGTCLKKCYIPDYRFSEDLDFTILDEKFVFDKHFVNKITAKATELSFNKDFNRGILFKLKDIDPAQSNNEGQGFKVFLHYWGADHRKNDMPFDKQENWHHTIKLDINHTEEIIFPTITNGINHNYSDSAIFDNARVTCYSVEEMLSEKLRSLIQRKYTSPRDCYDIWYLKNNFPGLDWQKIREAFFRKISIKDIEFKSAEQLLNPRKETILKQHWETQLANQVPVNRLPGCNLVVTGLKDFLNNLFEKQTI